VDFIRMVLSRCGSLFRRERLDSELDEEVRSHIAFATEEFVARGMSQPEARRMALREFGGVAQVKERYRIVRGVPFLDSLVQDMRYALRQLRKSLGFSLTVVLTLALGVGSVTAVFSVVNAVLIKPYAFRDAERIVVWRESIREMERVNPLLPDNYRHYLNLKNHASSIEDAAILQNPVFSISTELDHPHMAEGLAVSPNFFSVLGVGPALGRDFRDEEAQTGRDTEVILTWGAWQRLFHGDPLVLGKTLRVGGVAETVIGVLPKSFRFPVVSMMPGEATHASTERYEVFKPLVPMPEELTVNDADFNYLVVARLKRGVSIEQAQSELDGIEKSTAAADHLPIHVSVVVLPFAKEITGNVSKPLWLSLAAVMGVLLMTCVNLANLQIARSAVRERETALRSALGAGRVRLLQGVLVENLLLGMIGGLGGVGFAVVGERLLMSAAASLPRMNEVHLNIPMLAFTLLLAMGTALAFGVIPALRSLRVLPQSALQSGSTRISGDRHTMSSRKVLVAIEVGCSVALLIVTGLIARSFAHLMTQDRQFNSQHVVVARTDLSAPRYSSPQGVPDNFGSDAGSKARAEMIDRTLDRLRSIPGVQSVAITNVIPVSGDMSEDNLVRPDHPLAPGEVPIADRRFSGPGYFNTMEIPILAGRDFTQQDRANPRVTILSEKAAKAAFPNGDALGHTIEHWGQIYTVVGIAADARINDLKRDVPIFYLPYWDFPPANPVFLVRSAQGIETLGPAMRQGIWSVDPDISIPTVIALDAQVNESVATERFQALILSGFGGAALILAVIGIYGILAYSVTQKTTEFGIRIALGSSKGKLVRLALGGIALPVGFGVLMGLFVAFLMARWIGSLLYETSSLDPWSIGMSIAVLLIVSSLAALAPMRRAISVDPMSCLRSE
jgi:predicted permease